LVLTTKPPNIKTQGLAVPATGGAGGRGGEGEGGRVVGGGGGGVGR
jgi:hypothetical protein